MPSNVFKKSSFYRFGTHLFLIVLLGTIIAGVILYIAIPKELPSTYLDALKEIQALRKNLYLKAYLIYLPVAVFIFIGVFALSQSLTKKIVPPLISVSDFSKALKDGDFSKRPPGEGSDLSPLVARLDELIDSYQGRLGTIKNALPELMSVQKNIGEHLERDNTEEIKEELKKLLKLTNEIDKILEKIRA